MKKCIELLKNSPIITGVIGLIVAFGGMKLLKSADGGLLKMFALRTVLFLSLCVFLYLISREKSFEHCHKTTGYVVKWSLLTMIYYIIMLPIHLLMGEQVASDWPVKLILSIFLCISVGLYEETAYRVLINDAILYKFRNSKYVFVWIALISSLFFGTIHVVGAGFPSGSAIVSAILKIIQTGLIGFCFLVLYWKTRNIWGIAVGHAIFDGLSVVPAAFFDDTSDIGSADMYVNSGGVGIASLLVLIVLLGIAALIIWKKVGKTIDFEEIRRTW